MQNFIELLFLAVAVSALPQPFPQIPGVVSPEEAAAAALAAYMPNGLTPRSNQIIPVVVGGVQKVFVPNVVTAAVGDVVQFQFANGNHTVTQSAQDVACQPLQATLATAIHSGHIPFVDGQTTVGTFSMPVLNTDPMFLYCATGPHCQQGQVLIVNPANTQQIVDYAKLSAAAAASGDGTNVVGGTVAQIPLAQAAFVPAPAAAAAAPAAAAPAAAGAGTTAAAVAATNAAVLSSSTTTVIVTVTPTA